MTTGTIKKVVSDRGFGFIAAEDGKEYFFHRGGLVGPPRLRSPRRRRACLVRNRDQPQGPARRSGERGLVRSFRHFAARTAVVSGRGAPRLVGRFHLTGVTSSRGRLSFPPTPRVSAASRRSRTISPRRSASARSSPFTRPTNRAPIRPKSATGSGATSRADYPYVAHALNDCGVNVVSVQYEPGIWGGEDGAYVLDFVRALRIPMVATLHNVPAAPHARAAGDPDRAGRVRPSRSLSCRKPPRIC